MSQNLWSVESELHLPGVSVQTCTLHSPNPEDVLVLEPMHVIGLSLSQMPAYSQGRYHPDLPSTQFGDFGRVVFRPAGIPLHSRNSGGPHKTIRCVFEKGYLDRLAGLDDDWDGWKLAACLDMRRTGIPASLLRLGNEARAPGFGTVVMAEGLAMTIAADLGRYLDRSLPTAPKAGGLAPWQLRRITEFLQEAEGEAPTAADLATLCGISRGHLMRSFKSTTGQTLHQHIEDVRAARAKVLLAESRMSLKEIAAALGFSGPSSFSVAFRRAVGLPPAAFRRRLGGA